MLSGFGETAAPTIIIPMWYISYRPENSFVRFCKTLLNYDQSLQRIFLQKEKKIKKEKIKNKKKKLRIRSKKEVMSWYANKTEYSINSGAIKHLCLIYSCTIPYA